MRKTVFILPSCSKAPNSLIAGVSCRERLSRSLEANEYDVVGRASDADLKIQACYMLIDGEKVHLCEKGVNAIEDRLLNSLRKPADGLIARLINRRISLAITKRLMNTSVMPNHITILTLVLGLACGFVVALGGYWAGIWGALLFQMQSTLDGVDGELARLRFQGSLLGQWLDTISDDLSELSFVIGLTVITQFQALRMIGIVGIAVFVLTQGILYYRLATVYRSGDLQVIKWDSGSSTGIVAQLRFMFRHDFFCFISVVLAVLNSLDVLLVMATVGRIAVFTVLVKYLVQGEAPRRTALKDHRAEY